MTTIINKVPAAQEDLAIGLGQTNQTRQGNSISVSQIGLYWLFETVDEIKALDITKYSHSILVMGSNAYRYYYDSTSSATPNDTTVIKPDVGPGNWLVQYEDVVVNTISDMLNLSNVFDGTIVTVLGYNTVNDGGGGTFYYDASSNITPDNGITFGTGPGQFIRLFSGLVNVKWFGAVFDGVTDDEPFWTATIGYLDSNNGGNILFPAGTSRVNKQLDFPDRVGIIGEGDRVSILIAPSLVSGAVISSTNFGSGAVNQFNHFYDFSVYGPGKASGVDCIRIASFAGRLERLQLRDGQNGLVIGNTGNSNSLVELDVVGCKIHEQDIGIFIAGQSKATDLKLERNVINACDTACIDCENSGGTTFIGNEMYNAPYLLRISPVANNTVISSNQFGEADLTALRIVANAASASTSVSVVGNVFKSANENNTAVNDDDKALITLFNNGASGDLDVVTITGNILRDASGNAKFGVYIFGTLNNCNIGPNAWEGDFVANSGDLIRYPGVLTGIAVNEPSLGISFTGKTFPTVTIASGEIDVENLGNYILVDTEGAAATDDLFVINGLHPGQEITLMAADSTRTVVVKDGTQLKVAGDMSLDNTEDTIKLVHDGTISRELTRSNNGA